MSRPVSVGVALPGLRSPSVGFEAPFEMLSACHERVERMLDLLVRLRDHVAKNGCDAQAAIAAADVMRYFDQAAPQHHLDEERHVFPAVLALQNGRLDLMVYRLRQEHLDMEKLWSQVRQALALVAHSDAQNRAPFSDADQASMDAFTAIYKEHILAEEDLVYPEAKRSLGAEQLTAMSRDMVRRRGAHSTEG
ncbi:MAG: hemerythrin domain-containing protein [Limnohabitans sp.]|jgi:hemerythrin-like domain-containing protein|uniref:hemerythrin domain-containing protein n=1 Tax=Limnohabitans sp. TaxID=1907725 RepID=UPI003BAE709A